MSPIILKKKLLPIKMVRVISGVKPGLFRFGFLIRNEKYTGIIGQNILFVLLIGLLATDY